MDIRIRPAHIIASLAGVTVFIAAFLPWATVELGFMSVSQSGIEADDGIATLVLALAALGGVALSIYGRTWGGLLPMIAGVLITIIGIYDWFNVDRNTDADTADLVSVGAGLVLTTIGGMILTGAGAWEFIERSRAKH